MPVRGRAYDRTVPYVSVRLWSFHFTSAGSEFSLTDLGGNTGGGATGPWLAPRELPNTITCNDRPPVVPPPPPSPW